MSKVKFHASDWGERAGLFAFGYLIVPTIQGDAQSQC
jgi:hypothetical protein